MDLAPVLDKLKEFKLDTKEKYLAKAFSRNIGLISPSEQDMLANAAVGIPGMGGVGGAHLITLARSGVGRFHLADFDAYEPVNVNRQYGARIPDFGRPKLEVMKQEALRINPYLEIKEFPEGINRANMDDFLDGVQVVLDGLDFFEFATRRLLFNRALEKGVYVITAGPMGFSAAMLLFAPHEGMGFDEYFNIVEGMKPEEQYLAFAVGLAPKALHFKYMDNSKVDLESKKGPSLGIACQICAGMAATEALRIILKRGPIKPVPYFFQFDPYLQKYKKGKLPMGNRNPIQRLKINVIKRMLLTKKFQSNLPVPQLPDTRISSKHHITEELLRYIMEAGIQAPSGDNAQPWRFSCDQNSIRLYLNRDADDSFFNIRRIASVISCGAVLENMRVAATAFGLKAQITDLPSDENEDLMASMAFIPGGTPKDPLFDSLWKRNTNRRLYKKRALPDSVMHHLRDMMSDFPGAELHLIHNLQDMKKLARIIYNVDRIRTEHRPLHEHLCKMIRYTHAEAVQKRDGFSLKNLQAGLAGEIFLKVTRPWKVMHIANKIGLGRMIALHSYQGMINAAGAALLTVDGMGPEDFIKGGQALERIWLGITRKGLSLQPMTAVTLFRLRWHLEGEGSFSESHQRLLRNVWKDYQTLFPRVNFSKQGQVMLFRLGYGEEIQHRTFRKDLDHFWLNDIDVGAKEPFMEGHDTRRPLKCVS